MPYSVLNGRKTVLKSMKPCQYFLNNDMLKKFVRGDSI